MVLSTSTAAFAAGFEVPENTTKSVGRGGTGAVNKRDPSALYFNPALLERARGAQVLLNVNLLNLNLEFQRDPLVNEENRRNPKLEYDAIRNQSGFFPAPFLTASWDLGIENLTIGAGLFGPSGYGQRCYGKLTDSGCDVDEDNGGRYMMVGTTLIEAFASLGAGYRIELPYGDLSVGASAAATYLDSDFTLVIHGGTDRENWEDPENDAVFRGNGLSDWALSGTFGLAYDIQGFRLAASYRPPISWEAEGTAELTPAPSNNLGELTDDGVTLRTEQAGVLRMGFGLEAGEHPGDATRPRYDFEFNMVWEDWSRVDRFEITPHGKLKVLNAETDLGTLYQVKGYEDTFSFRLGGSYAFNDWLTGHAGGYYETGAQAEEYTNLDFVSWNRYAGGLGATFNVVDGFDFDVAYMHVYSPERHVDEGEIYKQSLSETEGGTAQNTGTWNSSFQLASFGVTYRYD
ncbi:hypothetical protein FIV42_03345 [Persicimonas caeni]|uniref:Aromatic hydrocarbon degradation protein n=1 Tax=Persicimonas caeni TaxID=2292766 RepID=A0A4Y6PNC3_PERCE|nr:outer membrane protein transport protein [Persicimonas caeni]QDG49806.1 hypothetical protein FIV42_03345 [Persicimonas caeni]QED31027.1 hypothetical protein FRD00_03340 [Persicimonas caeni]